MLSCALNVQPADLPPVLTEICESDLPLDAALQASARGERVALAVITGVEGASYRPLGAAMVCPERGSHLGNLSSGCIERDVLFHAQAALVDNQPRRLLYGAGSPFKDLVLPCGGGLEITLLPNPDVAGLRAAQAALQARRRHSLVLSADLAIDLRPQLRFLVFGKGPEARCFAELAHAAGYLVEGFTPEADLPQTEIPLTTMLQPRWPEAVTIDAFTAVALFFHDHDWEPPLLAAALRSEAFYVGAQGSQRAAAARDAALRACGLPESALQRLARPFGLIPSVRDPRSLAVSVLAQVVSASTVSWGRGAAGQGG